MRTHPYLIAALLMLTPVIANAEDVAAASAAFSEAQRAQLRGDYSRAAELFELADQSAPSPAALRSAIRNRETAGQDVRAASLALRALERYPNDRETKELAEATLGRLSPKLGRLKVTCSVACSLTVDGGLVAGGAAASKEFFVTAGAHTVEATWPDRPAVSKSVDASAGSSQALAIEAPAPEPKREAPPAAEEPTSTTPSPAPAGSSPSGSSVTFDSRSASTSGGMSPAVFWVGTGLTVVAGGLLTWSGLDTLKKAKDYEKNPTQEGYNEGVDLELRTNVLAGATGVLGVSTILIGIFATDWSGGSASAQVSKDNVALTYRGRFP